MNPKDDYAVLNNVPRELHAAYHADLRLQRRNYWKALALLLTLGVIGAHKYYLKQRSIAIANTVLGGFCIASAFILTLQFTVATRNYGMILWIMYFLAVSSFGLFVALLMDLLQLKSITDRANQDIQQALLRKLAAREPDEK